MKKDNFKTDVIFRKFPEDNEVIAVFPYEIYNSCGGCISYMHTGQHGEAEYSAVMKNAKPCKSKEEYQKLFDELESIGYNLKVVKRRNYNKYLNALYEARK